MASKPALLRLSTDADKAVARAAAAKAEVRTAKSELKKARKVLKAAKKSAKQARRKLESARATAAPVQNKGSASRPAHKSKSTAAVRAKAVRGPRVRKTSAKPRLSPGVVAKSVIKRLAAAKRPDIAADAGTDQAAQAAVASTPV